MKSERKEEISREKMTSKSEDQATVTLKSDEGHCSVCKKVLKIKTLNKNNGVCGKCKDPSLDRKPCPGGCGNSYKESTYKKNKGTCAKCAKNNAEKVEETGTKKSSKVACAGCGKQFSQSSLNSSGSCKKCSNSASAKEGISALRQNGISVSKKPSSGGPPSFKFLDAHANGTISDEVPSINNPLGLSNIVNLERKPVSIKNEVAKEEEKPISLKIIEPKTPICEGEVSSEDEQY